MNTENMKAYEILLEENKKWAAGKVAEDPEFFDRLAHLQTPNFLIYPMLFTFEGGNKLISIYKVLIVVVK